MSGMPAGCTDGEVRLSSLEKARHLDAQLFASSGHHAIGSGYELHIEPACHGKVQGIERAQGLFAKVADQDNRGLKILSSTACAPLAI